jgi:ankyrin repeat protein
MPEADPGSLVYTAAYHGNVRHLKKLLQRHAKELDSLLRWPHPHGGATAIYVACEFGHTDAVKLLLEAKAPPDQPREDGATPLYKACQDGKLDIVKLLLKHGAKVDQIDANQMTALWVACHQGHIELAKVLLEAKADPTFKVQEWTPIMLAEREQRNELVELLGSKGLHLRLGDLGAVEVSDCQQQHFRPRPHLAQQRAAPQQRQQLREAKRRRVDQVGEAHLECDRIARGDRRGAVGRVCRAGPLHIDEH